MEPELWQWGIVFGGQAIIWFCLGCLFETFRRGAN